MRVRFQPAPHVEPGNQLRLGGGEDAPREAPVPQRALGLIPGALTRRAMLDAVEAELGADRERARRALEGAEIARAAALALASPDAKAVVAGRRGRRFLALRRQAHASILEAEGEAYVAALRGEYIDEHGEELRPREAVRHARRKRSLWWRGRLRGFVDRPADERKCGAEVLTFVCQGDGGRCRTRTSFRRRCDQRLLCGKCAMRRAARDARTHMEAVTRLDRALRNKPHRAQLSWKLLTVTVEPGDDLPARVAALKHGVRRLRRRLRRYIARYGNPGRRRPCPVGGLSWFPGAALESFEVTEGTAREGHPHAHLLVLTPWIDPAWLRDTLKAVGLGRVSDIRAIRTRPCDAKAARNLRTNGVSVDPIIHAALREVLKYAVKPLDCSAFGYQRRTDGGFDRVWSSKGYAEHERAATLQRLDAALYGRRTVERTGLLRAKGIYVARVPACPVCGGERCRRFEAIWAIEDWEAVAERARPSVSWTRAPPLGAMTATS